MRYQTIDRCSEPDCHCDDRAGVILYDGPDYEAAQAALSQARYPDPEIMEIHP